MNYKMWEFHSKISFICPEIYSANLIQQRKMNIINLWIIMGSNSAEVSDYACVTSKLVWSFLQIYQVCIYPGFSRQNVETKNTVIISKKAIMKPIIYTELSTY